MENYDRILIPTSNEPTQVKYQCALEKVPGFVYTDYEQRGRRKRYHPFIGFALRPGYE